MAAAIASLRNGNSIASSSGNCGDVVRRWLAGSSIVLRSKYWLVGWAYFRPARSTRSCRRRSLSCNDAAAAAADSLVSPHQSISPLVVVVVHSSHSATSWQTDPTWLFITRSSGALSRDQQLTCGVYAPVQPSPDVLLFVKSCYR